MKKKLIKSRCTSGRWAGNGVWNQSQIPTMILSRVYYLTVLFTGSFTVVQPEEYNRITMKIKTVFYIKHVHAAC